MLFVCLVAFIGIHGALSCCTPKQWEGTVTLMGEVYMNQRIRVLQGEVQMHYDAINMKKAVVRSMNANGISNRMFLLEDYLQGIRYVVQGNMCNVTKVKDTFEENCVPAFANLLAETHLGVGEVSLGVSNFAAVIKQRQAITQLFLGITTDLCVPVTKRIISTGMRGDIVMTNIFSGIDAGIKDPEIFTPPDICTEVLKYEQYTRRFQRSTGSELRNGIESFVPNFNVFNIDHPELI